MNGHLRLRKALAALMDRTFTRVCVGLNGVGAELIDRTFMWVREGEGGRWVALMEGTSFFFSSHQLFIHPGHDNAC